LSRPTDAINRDEFAMSGVTAPQPLSGVSSRGALRLAAVGVLALAGAAGLLWMRFGREVFTVALQAAWTCF
jgi:hypothetical protein